MILGRCGLLGGGGEVMWGVFGFLFGLKLAINKIVGQIYLTWNNCEGIALL